MYLTLKRYTITKQINNVLDYILMEYNESAYIIKKIFCKISVFNTIYTGGLFS